MALSCARAAAPVDFHPPSAAPLSPSRQSPILDDCGADDTLSDSDDARAYADAVRSDHSGSKVPRLRRTRSDSDLGKVVLSPAAAYAGHVQLRRRRDTLTQPIRSTGYEENDGAAETRPTALHSVDGAESDLPILPFRSSTTQLGPGATNKRAIEDVISETAAWRDVELARGSEIAGEAATEARRRRRSASVESKASSVPSNEKAADTSPYPEVRASVPSDDDPDALVLTLRVWVIGLAFCAVVSAVNAYWGAQFPAPVVTPLVTQILAYPIGLAFAKYLPGWTYSPPTWARYCGIPRKLSLNPGPFSRKELTLLTMMANISTAAPWAYGFTFTAEQGYDRHVSFGFEILFVLSSQTLGYGIAGLTRRFLVWPASMIWPQTLVYCAVLGSMTDSARKGWHQATQLRFFAVALMGAFCWYWFPGARQFLIANRDRPLNRSFAGFLFSALSAFSWICWIAPGMFTARAVPA